MSWRWVGVSRVAEEALKTAAGNTKNALDQAKRGNYEKRER